MTPGSRGRDEVDARLDAAHDALDNGDCAAAERFARGIEKLVEALDEPGRSAARLECYLLRASIAAERQDDDMAFAWLARARELAPDDPEADYVEAQLRLERWEFDAADRLAARCVGLPGEPGAVEHLRATIADLREDFERADVWYAAAAELAPVRYPAPVRIDHAVAQEFLAGIVESFPAAVRDALHNVQVDLVDVPKASLDAGAADEGPLLMGIYAGVPITERVDGVASGVDSIRIFKRNIERDVRSRDELFEQLRITLLHEVGHHLGWDEADLDERGLG